MHISTLHKIPLLVVGVVFVVALLRIYIRSKKITRNEFFKILKSIKFITAWTLIFVFVLTCAFAVLNHMKSMQYVSAVVSLNYSEASQAQNSNGTRYNMTEIICDEVVERAIEMGAFENVTVKQLKNCLVVYPYIQGDVNDEANYHISTEFVVEYYASKYTEHLDAENVIALITAAYKDYYIEKYTDNFSLTNKDEKPDYSEMEYMDIVAYLNKETTSVLNYLYGMAEKAPSYVTSNNTTFNSIAGRVFQFKQTQIEENLRSIILQHGIVRDGESYVDRLTYHNINTDFTKQKNTVSFDLCNEAIAMYAEEMTRVVLVPTWDQSGKYYMGRTKVGIDELSVMATVYSNQVAENEKDILNNSLIIDKLSGAVGNTATRNQADELIETIDKTLSDFKIEAINAGREYADYKMNQCIAVNIYGSSIFGEIKTVAIFAVLAYISALSYGISKKFPKA